MQVLSTSNKNKMLVQQNKKLRRPGINYHLFGVNKRAFMFIYAFTAKTKVKAWHGS